MYEEYAGLSKKALRRFLKNSTGEKTCRLNRLPAQRASGIAADGDFVEVHREGVEGEQRVGERCADAEQAFDHFDGLDGTDGAAPR
jgi:hypothetical protein